MVPWGSLAALHEYPGARVFWPRMGVATPIQGQFPRAAGDSCDAWGGSGSVEPEAAQSADVAHPALGQPVGGDGRRYAVLRGQLEDRVGRVVDARRPLLGALVVGNFAWVAACGVLLFHGAVSPTPLGQAYLVVQAVAVLVLAELQWMALRRTRPAAMA